MEYPSTTSLISRSKNRNKIFFGSTISQEQKLPCKRDRAYTVTFVDTDLGDLSVL